MTFVVVYDDVLYMYSTNMSAQNLKNWVPRDLY